MPSGTVAMIQHSRDPNTHIHTNRHTVIATVTQPNSILEFLKRPVSNFAKTTASGLEAPHGKHKRLPLQASHSTVGKHERRSMTQEAYATKSICITSVRDK